MLRFIGVSIDCIRASHKHALKLAHLLLTQYKLGLKRDGHGNRTSQKGRDIMHTIIFRHIVQHHLKRASPDAPTRSGPDPPPDFVGRHVEPHPTGLFIRRPPSSSNPFRIREHVSLIVFRPPSSFCGPRLSVVPYLGWVNGFGWVANVSIGEKCKYVVFW